jgi:Zn finger protein HypA/HybF involved in hydrogenase expression
MTTLKRGRYETPSPDEAAVIEAALTGPFPSCPRCGAEDKQVLYGRPTLVLEWSIESAGHLAPCGLPCAPYGISYVGECQFHLGTDDGVMYCPRCGDGKPVVFNGMEMTP